MENIAHTLFGLALARCGLDRRDRLVTPTLVVAANLPDIDTLGAIWGGKAWYLVHHRGLSHSILGVALQIPLLAVLVWALSRGRANFRAILAASAIGLASHPFLDALNVYGVRPFIPFDWTWYYGDVAFILDPWLWLFFGAAACLGGSGGAGRRGDAAWFVSALLAVVFLFVAGPSRGVPGTAAGVWAAGALAVAWLRARRFGSVRRGLAVAAALGVAAVYLGGLAIASRVALARGVAELAEVEVTEASAFPLPVVPWRFDVVAGNRETLHRLSIDLARGTVRRTDSIARNLDDPALSSPAIAGTPEYEAWRHFARHPFAAADAQGHLVLGDGRYEMKPVLTFCSFRMRRPER